MSFWKRLGERGVMRGERSGRENLCKSDESNVLTA